MFLNTISLRNFHNIGEAEVTFSPKINCITGNNGAGKTNLLDAVYYLSMTKSFFSQSDQYVLKFGSDETTLCGVYRMDSGTEEKISVCVRKGGEKTVRRGAKNYTRFSEHIGLLPVVMVSPTDSALINDSGDERRKYMNFILSQVDRQYLSHIQAYNQLLLHRNRLLKEESGQSLLLDTITERMSPHASYVFEKRKSLCRELLPMVQNYYGRLCSDAETVSLEYRSDLDGTSMEELAQREADKERALRYTTAGIQRDDIAFSLGEHPIRRCGSQGQQKSFLLAMKLAQYLFIKRIYRQTPVLLLDDVFDKLDTGRVERLLDIVSSPDFGQIFISDCNTVRLEASARKLDADFRSFKVENGKITQS